MRHIAVVNFGKGGSIIVSDSLFGFEDSAVGAGITGGFPKA